MELAGKKMQPIDVGHYDLVVVGGGYAGTCAAISAARWGAKSH
jgi:succinate dehydrogenase/fumarate reductase flavoprotein subunit